MRGYREACRPQESKPQQCVSPPCFRKTSHHSCHLATCTKPRRTHAPVNNPRTPLSQSFASRYTSNTPAARLPHPATAGCTPAAIYLPHLHSYTSFVPPPQSSHGLCCNQVPPDQAHELRLHILGHAHSFVKINGEPTHEDDFGIPSTWTPRSCDTVQALSAAVAGLITKHLAIPLSACRCFGASHMIMLS